MARIRSIKPEFFKHFELQELECANPGQYIMLVYSGLWTQCDKNGVFLYNAKIIKNEILPYIDFDMQKTLDILEKEGYFARFKSDSREYGHIQNFSKYQFPTKNEKDAPSKYPEPPINNDAENHTGNIPENVLSNVPGNDAENHTEAEGIWNLESGSQDNRTEGSQDQRKKDSGASAPRDSEISDPQKLFLYYWQHTPDIFNALSRIESPKEWDRFWKNSHVTCEQVKTAMDNFIADVRCGAIERRFIPSLPDRFALKGWITKCQKRFQNKTAPPSGASQSSRNTKKSLL